LRKTGLKPTPNGHAEMCINQKNKDSCLSEMIAFSPIFFLTFLQIVSVILR